jgi:hypothetical protein
MVTLMIGIPNVNAAAACEWVIENCHAASFNHFDIRSWLSDLWQRKRAVSLLH